MTQRVRADFLNFQPDVEDLGNSGLVVADNVIHEPEGYKPVYLNTAGSFQTTQSLQTVTSVVSKPVGSQGDLISAWIRNNILYIGINGITMLNASTTPVFSTTGSQQSVVFFDVAEFEGSIYIQAEAQQTESNPATVPSVYAYGYSTITVA